YEYSFKLKLNKLTAVLNEDGTVSIMDEETGRSIYSMPAPFMFDDNGVLSTDVYYTLTQKGKYEYELTVTASTEWINARVRKFPVTIDPTVEVTNSYYEAYVSSTSPSTNYGSPSDGRLYVSPTQRTFLKFDLPNIGSNVLITNADLMATYFFTQNGSATIGAYEVPYSWNENTITWNNSIGSHQTLESGVIPFTQEPLSGSSELYPITMHLDITEAVEGWYAGKSNNGIAIKCMSSSDSALVICGYNYVGQNSYYDNVQFEITYQITDNNYNGTYYIRNVGIDTYIESDRSDILNYDNARLGAFNGDTDQKWSLTYLHNGYYSIKSNVNGEALTAYLEDDNEILLATYTATDNQMWKITVDSNGNYMISPKNNLTCYAVPGALINSVVPNERYLVLNQSSSTTNGNKWIFYQVSTDGANFEYQQRSKWCWVACVRMICSVYIDVNDIPSQLEIAQEIKANYADINQPATISEIEDTLEFILGKVNVYTINDGHMNDEMLENFLDAGAPVIANIKEIDHYVVIYGYEKVNGVMMLNVYDPYNFVEFGDQIPENVDTSIYPMENQYTIEHGPFSYRWEGALAINVLGLE
ncbi:MAG: DNRLRE domain-containing protein, partial [Clostridia bacterium]|nr:DNRLRE domain-containing protein [Clostridia bacterium]